MNIIIGLLQTFCLSTGCRFVYLFVLPTTGDGDTSTYWCKFNQKANVILYVLCIMSKMNLLHSHSMHNSVLNCMCVCRLWSDTPTRLALNYKCEMWMMWLLWKKIVSWICWALSIIKHWQHLNLYTVHWTFCWY